MTRGLPSVALMMPTPAELTLPAGEEKFTMFITLKNSPRNSAWSFSVIGIFLLHREIDIALAGASHDVASCIAEVGAGLGEGGRIEVLVQPVFHGAGEGGVPRGARSEAGATAGHAENVAPPLSVTVNGVPDCRMATPETVQPPKMRLLKPKLGIS